MPLGVFPEISMWCCYHSNQHCQSESYTLIELENASDYNLSNQGMIVITLNTCMNLWCAMLVHIYCIVLSLPQPIESYRISFF